MITALYFLQIKNKNEKNEIPFPGNFSGKYIATLFPEIHKKKQDIKNQSFFLAICFVEYGGWKL